MDCRELAADFAARLARVSPARAAKANALGNTPAGRRSLAAGLLLSAVFGANAVIEGNAFGKPGIPGKRPFNLSHAGDYAVLAVTHGDVGVDIERIRPVECLRIAERFFHPDETAYLCAQPAPLPAFFQIWTLKESYQKALGRGFSVPPTSFCVLPAGEGGATFAGETPFSFRRYDDAFPGYRLSVCALDADFPDGVTMVRAADVP